MEAFILIALLVVVAIVFRRFSNCVYFIAIADIFFRLVEVINEGLVKGISKELYKVLNYIPSSIPSLLQKYLPIKGLPYQLCFWGYVIIMCIFLGYTVRIFFKRKK